jgi:hypothetical protein
MLRLLTSTMRGVQSHMLPALQCCQPVCTLMCNHADPGELTASRALLSTLFSTRKDLLQELLSEAELGFAWRRVLPVPQGYDSGHLSIALLKRLNAASQSHVSAAGLEQVVSRRHILLIHSTHAAHVLFLMNCPTTV